MAMYHFRLKSDKKPNGTKISAVQHVDYIRREGAYSGLEQRQEQPKFVGNVITTAEKPNALGGQNVLLYKTDEFGSIRNSPTGIEVSEKASPITVSIALMLASETMKHQPLILHGSSEFQQLVVNAAAQDDLEITFADTLIQSEFEHRKEEIENDRRKFVASGGTVVTKRPKSKPVTAPARAQTIESAPKRDFACQHCPNSLWFIQNQKQLTCYCRLMNVVSWTASQKTSITMCDGILQTSEKD